MSQKQDKVRRLVRQFRYGCGTQSCTNFNCASNEQFASLPAKAAALKALLAVKQNQYHNIVCPSMVQEEAPPASSTADVSKRFGLEKKFEDNIDPNKIYKTKYCATVEKSLPDENVRDV